MNGGFGGRSKPQRIAQRPKALICYICGRQYGTNSLKIHLKSCIKIWEEREMLKPKRDRKPVPKAPATIEQALNGRKKKSSSRGGGKGMSAKAMQEQNEAAFNAFNSNSLDACPHCGRTFLAERLEKHLLSCKPGNIMGKKLKAGSGLAGGNLGGLTQTKEREEFRPHTTSPRNNFNSNINNNSVKKNKNQRKKKNNNDDDNNKPWRRRKGTNNNSNNAFMQNTQQPSHNSPKITIVDNNSKISYDNNIKKFQSVSQGSEISPVDLEWNIINNATTNNNGNSNTRNAANMEDKWERAIDLKTNRPYYFNTRTGKRRWTKPSDSSSRSSTNEDDNDSITINNKKRNGKGSRAGSIWGNEDEKSMDSFFEKHNFNQNGNSTPRTKNGTQSPIDNSSYNDNNNNNNKSMNDNNKGSIRERSKSYRQRVKATAEQSNLENRVEELESKLAFALDEISRLNKVVQKFQTAFSNLNNISPRS